MIHHLTWAITLIKMASISIPETIFVKRWQGKAYYTVDPFLLDFHISQRRWQGWAFLFSSERANVCNFLYIQTGAKSIYNYKTNKVKLLSITYY
jgi:hypothetical protein